MIDETLWSYETSVWSQSLRRVSGGAVLRRTIKGITDAERLARNGVNSRLRTKGWDAPTRPIFSDGSSEPSIYSLSSIHQSVRLLWPSPVAAWSETTGSDVSHALAAFLAELHSAKTELPVVPSPHVKRLRSHLYAEEGFVHRSLPGSAVGMLTEWVEALPDTGVLCHGGWSLSSIFASEDLSQLQVVSGEEITLSARELDLGWIVGELTELEFSASSSGQSGALYAALASLFLGAYHQITGYKIDPAFLARVVALRTTLHLFDFAETFGEEAVGQSNIAFATWLTERASML